MTNHPGLPVTILVLRLKVLSLEECPDPWEIRTAGHLTRKENKPTANAIPSHFYIVEVKISKRPEMRVLWTTDQESGWFHYRKPKVNVILQNSEGK